MKLTFGRHKGEDITTVSQDYLEWAEQRLVNLPKLQALVVEELKRRYREEQEFKNLIAENPEDPELIKQLKKHFWAEYEKEVEESDCEHEYDRYNPIPQIEKEVADYILIATTDKRIKELRQKYSQDLGGKKTLDKIVSFWLQNDYISKENFSSEEKFNLANKFLTEYKKLLTDEYYEAIM